MYDVNRIIDSVQCYVNYPSEFSALRCIIHFGQTVSDSISVR